MAGSYVEGQYLVGMLTGKNLFRDSGESYYQALHTYIEQHVSGPAATIFCTSRNDWLLIPFLRRAYHRNPDWPPMNVKRNEREERAMEYLLFHLDATIDDLADQLGTTTKQVERLTSVNDSLFQIQQSKYK